MIHNNKPFNELVKTIRSFAYSSGMGLSRVFEDLMNYIVYGFCVNGKMPRWDYKPEQSKEFWEMFRLWTLAAEQEIDQQGWCDVPGNLHQNVIYSKNGKGFLGQYFSPEHICDCMCRFTSASGGHKPFETVYDCACGSGRMLLAANAEACEQHRHVYCAAKDIDETCVKMTVANFLLQGVVGEVVYGDGLNPSDGRLCFLVNEHLNDPASELFGIPHCRIVPLCETMQGQVAA